MGLELFGILFFLFGDFFGFTVLANFFAICSILNLEVTIYTVFASILGFEPFFIHSFCSFSWNLQHFGAGSCHFSGFVFYMIASQFSFFPQFSLILTWCSLIFLKFWLFLEIHDVQTIDCRCIEAYMRNWSCLCAHVDKRIENSI